MTHFLHHYKATSLACSQMVSLVVNSCSLSLFLRKLLALEQLAQLSINNNHFSMLCKEEDAICAVAMYSMHVSIHKCECEQWINLILTQTDEGSCNITLCIFRMSVKMLRDHSQIQYVSGIARRTHLSLTVSWQSLWQLYRLLHYPEAMLLNHSQPIKICAYAYIHWNARLHVVFWWLRALTSPTGMVPSCLTLKL